MAILSRFLAVAALVGVAAADPSVGDRIPSDVTLDVPTGEIGFPPNKINLSEYVAGRKVILMGLPGAFTPTCSSVQIPGYLEKQDALKASGIDEVIVFAVNDATVMKAWSRDQNCEGTMIKFMGDPDSELTQALGLVLDHSGPMNNLGYPRCKRFAAYLSDGVFKSFHLSEASDDPAGDDRPEESCVENVLQTIEQIEGLLPQGEL